MAATAEERFWAKVDRGADCWVWTAARNPAGYGQFAINLGGRVVRGAHRVSWELHFGEIPAGMFVMHVCDNPPCVRPDHLRVGSAADNSRDMAMKGRNNPVPGLAAAWEARSLLAAARRAQRTHCDNGHVLEAGGPCRACQREATRRWVERHREEHLARRRELRQRPEAKAKANAYQNLKRAENPQAYRDYMREYYRKRRAAAATP